jgi:hypothetical protein
MEQGTEVFFACQSPHAKSANNAIRPSHKGANALPYSALDVRCPKCGSYAGQACRSSKGRSIRYPHDTRVEASAAEYRSAVRLRILNRIRGLNGEEFGPRPTWERYFLAAREGVCA